VESPWARDVGRPDEAIGRAEVHHVANLVNGPANNRLDAIADRSQNPATATAFFRSATVIAVAGLQFAALATRIAVGRIALLNGHCTRDAIVGYTGRAATTNENQRRCEDPSHRGSMNGR
jgi:hypothetical protein